MIHYYYMSQHELPAVAISKRGIFETLYSATIPAFCLPTLDGPRWWCTALEKEILVRPQCPNASDAHSTVMPYAYLTCRQLVHSCMQSKVSQITSLLLHLAMIAAIRIIVYLY